jgi:D-sedoheptulose 7-phosphate isomerase
MKVSCPLIDSAISDAVAAALTLQSDLSKQFIYDVAELLAEKFRAGKKLIIAGNGGSLCDANHFAEELTGQFRIERPALCAISLSEPGHMSCVANDMGFERIFSRGVEAYGSVGDVFCGLTTSGNSQNLINAFSVAKELGLKTIAFLGKDGGKLKGAADYELIISGFKYSDRVQEAHMIAIHIIIEKLEEILFSS